MCGRASVQRSVQGAHGVQWGAGASPGAGGISGVMQRSGMKVAAPEHGDAP